MRLASVLGFLGAMLCSMAAQAETFTIGVETTAYYPQYSTETGSYQGLARDLLDAYAQDRGHRFTYVPMPVLRLYAALTNLDVDFKYPDNPLWQPDLKAGREVRYSDPVAYCIDGISVRPERRAITVDEVKTLGMVLGFSAVDWRSRVEAGQVRIQQNPSFPGLIQQTLLGRIDGAFACVAVIAYQLEKMAKPRALVLAKGLPHTRSDFHLSSVKHPEIVVDFNAWMREKAPFIKALKERYGVEKRLD